MTYSYWVKAEETKFVCFPNVSSLFPEGGAVWKSLIRHSATYTMREDLNVYETLKIKTLSESDIYCPIGFVLQLIVDMPELLKYNTPSLRRKPPFTHRHYQ